MAANGIILLIDNDINQNISNRGALERKRYMVYTATAYAQARQLIAETKPDVIVMEAVLPDGDGFAFCQEIRGQTKAYILFLTSKTGIEHYKKGLNSGGDMYLEKPMHMPELMARVDTAIRRMGV